MRKITFLLLVFLCVGSILSQEKIYTTGEIRFGTSTLYSVKVDVGETHTTITMVGPNNAWFAVGFGGDKMKNGLDVILTNGAEDSGAFEILDTKTSTATNKKPITDVSNDLTLVSTRKIFVKREVVVKRKNNTGDANDYVFSNDTSSLQIIWAYGNGTSYAYHAAKGVAVSGNKTLNIPVANRLEFDMFPNPASENLTIQLPSGEDTATVSFYDGIGRLALIQKISSQNSKINVENLSTGVYVLKVVTGDKIGTQRFVRK